MLEGLVAWVLNNYLGKYVENLNTDQLSIALLSGEVELENLPLRKDALRHLGIPIEIRAGFIGKVRLQVPVRQLRSAPWLIVIERLYVVAGPVCLERWDQAAEKLAEHERKLSALDAIEACWRNETETRQNGSSTYYASSYSSWLNYGTGIITDIVENLQLRIKDVHIRYEDSSSGTAIACGLSIRSLSAQNCDENWVTQFTHCSSSDGYSYKTIDLTSLALYWDHIELSDLMSDMSMSELAQAMDVLNRDNAVHHYIVAPVSGYAHVKRNRSELPLRSSAIPRIVCELHLNEVPIALADWQYEQLVRSCHTLKFIGEVQTYRRYRPLASIVDDPRSWWLYAVRCVCPGAWVGRWNLNWEKPLRLAKENLAYVRIYEAYLAQPTAVLPHADKKLKDHVEWMRDFEQLKVLREAAVRKVPFPKQSTTDSNNTGRSMLVQWFPQWWGWYSTPDPSHSTTDSTNQLEGQILEALTDAVRDNTLLKRDAVFGRFIFTLKKGALGLCTASKSDPKPLQGSSVPMLDLQFENFHLCIESRPRTSSHSLELELGSLCLRDLLTEGTLFPILVGPPEARTMPKSPRPAPSTSLFHLQYEVGTKTEHRLKVRSQPLDVVYHPGAVRWLIDFTCGPHQRAAARGSIEAVKARTKKHLMKNWESIVDGRSAADRTNASWDLQLDISAPQIIFVEKFCEQNSAIAVIDLGRLHVANVLDDVLSPGIMELEKSLIQTSQDTVVENSLAEEDDEMFVTPCSTPPGSESSRTGTETTLVTALDSLSERQLYNRLYERYTAELSDIQILTCRIRDGWRHAHTRGSSSMHVLEKFSISARCERRLVRTSDPMYPAFTLAASLPRLVIHVNENKVAAARILVATVFSAETASPLYGETRKEEMQVEEEEDISEDTTTATPDTNNSRLLMLQLTVEHVSLQVQSRGRSVAELQVTGASATFTRRPLDTGITLTVHGLLLVDALQTYGRDFELLVASHRHVAMDSVSGSLKDSEPTSPTSPGSPDPLAPQAKRATSPLALSKALSGLAVSPPPGFGLPFVVDPQEALICVEYTEVQGAEPVRIANIQFNNLDIIANQETLVELVGFIRRVFPAKDSTVHSIQLTKDPEDATQSVEEISTRTELTFDFHRLNVLLMRGVCSGSEVWGRKVATATMSEAKIQATVEGRTELSVRGSLGGLQVLDLTPEGHLHRRIVSVGMDPLAEISHHQSEYTGFYSPVSNTIAQGDEANKAFGLTISRYSAESDVTGEKEERLDVEVRMASVWYTHSPLLLSELQSCAAEFRQYLSNVAKSIKAAATDMALGLVHARSGSEQPVSFQRSGESPGHRRRSSTSISGRCKGVYHTHSLQEDDIGDEVDEEDTWVKLQIDVVLDSPVVVLPRSSDSTQVFVAHLGRISVDNSKSTQELEDYNVEIRDMNLYSLETAARRKGPEKISRDVSRAYHLYSCETLAEPVLHDTVVQLHITRQKNMKLEKIADSVLLDGEDSHSQQFSKEKFEISENLEVTGRVVNALRVSLTKAQYKQLLDTFRSLSTNVSIPNDNVIRRDHKHGLSDITEEHIGVGTLSMDPHVRARLFPGRSPSTSSVREWKQLKLSFELPVLTLELRREEKAVELCLGQFVFSCERSVPHETNIQVSLHSLHMNDLGQEEDSKWRHMVVSTAIEPYLPPPGGGFVSHSCPDLIGMGYSRYHNRDWAGSLPDHLVTEKILGAAISTRRASNKGPQPQPRETRPYPETPPPSESSSPMKIRRPVSDNLVLMSCLMVDPQLVTMENFTKMYNSMQQSTQVDFNSLNLVVSAESWGLVLDFFSGEGEIESVQEEDTVDAPVNGEVDETQLACYKTELSISVRSLTATFVRNNREIARANISGARVKRVNDLVSGDSETEGRLGSISLVDLTPHGKLYRERFQTQGERALHVSYHSGASEEQSHLRFEMASVLYVHTRRFVTELQTFFSGFGGTNTKQTHKKRKGGRTPQVALEVQAGAPLILLPVSCSSSELLVADLGRLTVKNTFRTLNNCPLDVMSVELLDMDLYAANRGLLSEEPEQGLRLGSGAIVKRSGRSLLDDKCRLLLTVERNLGESLEFPGLSIRGDLSTLQGALELSQYRLIRGLLAHNIGEPLDDLLPPCVNSQWPQLEEQQFRSTLTLLQLGLQNVTVRLNEDGGEPLASVHFISSKLTVENFSDGAQDIDLLSQEIVFVDTRCTGTNVFTEILRPGRTSEKCSGMEIHSRRRPDNSEFTVLLNNMRVMVIPDWWHSVREYIFTGPEPGPPPPEPPLQTPQTPQQETPYELKLNITDSEVVVVQETARKDTNALTLRSTTVISWKPCSAKPLSCNLNHCELFSCVAGHEDDTALSIIDPVTIGVELSKNGVLEVQVQQRLIVRLSYHDFRMLAEMARSVPKQAQTKRKPSVTSENPHIEENVRRLASLGFSIEDCTQALEECNKELEEAALWLTQHAIHDQRHELEHPSIPSGENNHSWTSVLVRASYLILTIIDDCGDADVPLAEVCLAELIAEQPLGKDEGTDAENEGSLECKLSCDYYNRALSGWEPCLEPWRCRVTWQSRRRLFINVNSDSLLDINITSALLELYRLVSDNWRRDMNQSTDGQVRRRRRFVPFALKNDTGSRLCFATVLASRLEEEIDSVDDIERSPEREIADDKKHAWKFVEPGETIPFEFSDSRTGKRRHGDTHRARLHRLRIQVSGWRQLAHVSVDRVGVYFRDISGREVNREPNSTRLVFDIQLEGSARKLVTVRSALVIINKLPDPVDVRLGATAEIMVKSGETLPVPLEYSHQQLHIRPTSEPTFSYCQPEIDWKSINQKSGETKHEARTCRIGGQRARVYHLSAEIRCEHKQEGTSLPAHTVVLMPAVLLINLLPHELHYTVIESDEDEEREFKEGPHTAAEGVIIPGMEAAVSSADPSERSLELQLRLEGFRCCSGVRLPRALPGAASSESQCILRLEDTEGRRLHLHIAIVTRGSTAGIRVVVSAPFWIINRTGLPLIFRQEGVASDTAGQFKEHEVARMVAPLLFSWTDSDASPSVTCRVGTKAVPGGQPHWCQHFHLRRGVQVRKLRVTHTGMGVIESITRPDTVFIIGIQVRFGRGRYRNTSIVTISPRYQIHNRSSKTLIFSQQCHATTISDPGARATHVEAVPGCQIPFHWPRLDKEHLLCVRCISDPANTGSLWSGGLRIDSPRSLHVSIRTSREVGAVKFLRLEVVSRGATLHAVFGDSADTLPAPLRVDNRSEVTIQFAQQEVSHTCVAKARSCVPYAWDEPDLKQPILIVTAPGGASAMCNMDKLGLVAQLTYENFIYVAFMGTFGNNAENGDRTSDDPPSSPSELTNQRLVLDVLEDEGGKVSLAVKQPGRRSQLWRMTSKGQLHHEGSPADRVLVLDIEGPAPQPSRRDSRLALRRPDPRRRSTQTWRFTADGRLCCAHENMCVQSQDGVWGLKPGGAAVLGVPREAPPHRLIHGVPIEQAVGKQRMRPGSGFLSVEVTTDGPTRVLAVRDDIADKRRLQNGEGQNPQQLASQTLEDGTEIRLVIRLNEGLGISIVGRGPPQELLYTRLSNIVAEISHCSGLRGSRQLCLSIGDIQCDNQLFGTDTEVVVYAARSRGIASEAERQRQGPALSISAELQNPFAPKPSVLIFRHLIVRVNPVAVHIEETLLLRMAEFLGTERSRDKQQDTPDAITDHTGEDEIKPGTDTAATSTHTRFYFGVISLAPGMVRLSVRTAGKLPSRLRSLRRRLGLTLIQFEDACIEVQPYVQRHSCDTLKSTWLSVYAHFKEELVWQAATIVGNVDFLGGPLGLMNDVSEGVSGLINERSVGALVMNVTHGISNSAAKVTDALGDGLGRVFIMDEAHEETRQRIRRTAAPAPSGHLVAGIKGFGFGLLDGATGLFRHVYAGATSDGVQGAMAGVGRGLVGMVAKPVVGVLDLAGEAARAVRDSSRGTSRAAPARKRLPRVAASGPGELLPRYGSGKEARGQAYLHQVNGGDRSERFVAYGSLRRSSVDDLRLIVGSEKVRVVTRGSGGTMTVVTEVRLQDVTSCGPVCDVRDPKDSTPRHYVELAVRAGGESPGAVRRPRIRCDTEEIARWAARQVNFARKILSERRYTLHAPDGGNVSTPM